MSFIVLNIFSEGTNRTRSNLSPALKSKFKPKPYGLKYPVQTGFSFGIRPSPSKRHIL